MSNNNTSSSKENIFNKLTQLFTITSLVDLVRVSPWVIIPVLLYFLGDKYIQNDKDLKLERQKQEFAERLIEPLSSRDNKTRLIATYITLSAFNDQYNRDSEFLEFMHNIESDSANFIVLTDLLYEISFRNFKDGNNEQREQILPILDDEVFEKDRLLSDILESAKDITDEDYITDCLNLINTVPQAVLGNHKEELTEFIKQHRGKSEQIGKNMKMLEAKINT